MTTSQPFNLLNWVSENKHLLVPPVANKTIYQNNKDFIVMIVAGPNARNDFHINQGEELFFQLEGHITVRLIDSIGKIIDQPLGPGDMMLVPGGTPHSPQRTAGSIGLVIERYRKENEQDGFVWYCENCNHKLYEHFQVITDIVSQLPPILNTFQTSIRLRTCPLCNTISELSASSK
jgi:3-hydroxyanthranilate 3,4-dioxygenase